MTESHIIKMNSPLEVQQQARIPYLSNNYNRERYWFINLNSYKHTSFLQHLPKHSLPPKPAVWSNRIILPELSLKGYQESRKCIKEETYKIAVKQMTYGMYKDWIPYKSSRFKRTLAEKGPNHPLNQSLKLTEVEKVSLSLLRCLLVHCDEIEVCQ